MCFCLCVEVVYVLSERHSSVVGHSKCGGGVSVRDLLTVQRDGRLLFVLLVPCGGECKCGFCCGEL